MEARAIWRDRIRVAPERIVGLGEKDNYWAWATSAPASLLRDPGRPGRALFLRSLLRHRHRDCDRYSKIWNLVFMQFNQEPGGKKVPCPARASTPAWASKRLAMVLQGG
jgi:alanyl-tRNA synthetase